MEIGSIEARVYRLAELLSEQRAATRENVQRKQARSGGELDDDEDRIGDRESDDSDLDDDDDVPYNPKNLPLGWDGKVRIIPQIILSLCDLKPSLNFKSRKCVCVLLQSFGRMILSGLSYSECTRVNTIGPLNIDAIYLLDVG